MMSFHHSSPRRRVVLGEKDTNLSPVTTLAHGVKVDKITVLKPAFCQLDGVFDLEEEEDTSDEEGNVVVKLVGGKRKRGIQMVEGVRDREDETEGDGETQETEGFLKTQSFTKPGSPESANRMTLLSSSTEGPVEIEEQFNIQEEMSQTAVENLNATVLPQNRSQLPQQSFRIEHSQESAGMSSLVDFFEPEDHEDTGGPQDKAREVEEEVAEITEGFAREMGLPPPGDARRAIIDQRAQMARTNLQLAMYKVRTGQADVPFSSLKVIPRQPQLVTRNGLPFVPQSSFEKGSVGIEQAKHDNDLPPSPFESVKEMELANARALARSRSVSTEPKTPGPPAQERLSPSKNLNKEGMMKEQTYLTSSVIKGEAADSLLKLRKLSHY